MKTTQNKIEAKFRELYEKKIKVSNMILQRSKKDFIEQELIPTKEQFCINKFEKISIYIPEFMNQLWNSPKSIATILLSADQSEVNKNLAHFIVHNLYDNISSINHKDDQLIYIFTLLLKEEIKSLNDLNEPLMKETKCGVFFEEFNKKNEVKAFFKNILFDIVQKVESTYSYLNIGFDPNEINDELNKILLYKETDDLQKNCDNMLNKIKSNFNQSENEEKFNLIKEKYINLPFNEEQLNKKLEEYENEEMRDFIQSLIIKYKSSPEKYLNNINFKNFTKKDNKGKIMNYYLNSFLQVTDIIDMIFDNLIENSHLLPYSIRCMCKVISTLINKAFPNSKKVEQNKILSKFFFKNLFFPILSNCSLNSLINEIKITKQTNNKLQIIIFLLYNIIFGDLISEKNTTPFNWYMIEKMPKLLKFFNNICEVNLPSFIEKLINDNLPENYEYDYFKENTGETILYRNIFYNIDELYALVTNAEKCKENISINELVLSKFRKNHEILKEIKENLKIIECGNTNDNSFVYLNKGIFHFLLTDLIINPEIEQMNKIKNFVNYNKSHFSLEEIKNDEFNEESDENNIIKIKNLFFDFLYNYKTLSLNNLKKENLGNIIDIFKEIKKNAYKYPLISNNFIPSFWYLDTLINNLPKLPTCYIENDYEKLFDELEKHIKNSLNELNYDLLEKFIDYSKEIDKEILIYENIIKIINDIDLNKLTNDIIQSKQIYFKSKTEDESCRFLKSIIKQKQKKSGFAKLFYKIKKGIRNKFYYNSIDIFINNFPNIVEYQTKVNPDDIFKLLKINKVYEIINNYLKLIKTHLKNYKSINETNLNEVHNKIYDYIMEKLHYKLFPNIPLSADMKIFQQCYRHIWIEYKYLTKENKNYIFDTFLPDSINYLKQFENEKSPRKKIICLEKVFKSIYDLGKFNGEKIEGLDNVFPLFNYIFIKAKPERAYSNYNYMEIFLKNKTAGKEFLYLSQIKAAYERMINMDHNQLYNITKSEYEQNCELVTQRIIH